MAYLSLYRKYRPLTFAEVAGQDHVVQTLQNALKSGRVANGYLFCGTRGVAKTTIARIFAKCLSCVGPDGTRTTPAPEPCNVCAPCRAITAGQCVDVLEMDAASNRSVTDMAKLRENVQFGPMENRYKTYIVDEAHQLSSDAKDAFLKTLEEPPSNVVFILATTESHAIPITIASRCQQFDFKRGTLTQIAQQISRVLDLESVTMNAEAINFVARAAEGSYRDALSILEQVLAYKRQDITASDVGEVLGAVETEVIDRVVETVVAGDAAAAFAISEEVYTSGKEIRQFLKTLAQRFRDLLFLRVGARAAEGAAALEGQPSVLHAQAARLTPAVLLGALEILTEAEREGRTTNQHRLLLEMALIKIVTLANTQVESKKKAAAPAIKAPEPIAALQQTPPATAAIEPVTSAGEQLTYLQKNWQQVLNHMQARTPSGMPVVRDAVPLSQSGHVITLGFSQKMHVDKLENPKARARIEEIINKVLHAEIGVYKVKAVMRPGDEPQAPPVASPVKPPARTGQPGLLDEVISVFGGKITMED